MHRFLALFLVLCGCDPAVEGPFSSCDPLDDALCALPFPSSFFLEEADGNPLRVGEKSKRPDPGNGLFRHHDLTARLHGLLHPAEHPTADD